MFYLFFNNKGIAMGNTKESLVQFASIKSYPNFAIVELKDFNYSPSDLSLNDKGEVIFPEIDKGVLFNSCKQQKLKELNEKTSEKITGGFISNASGEKVTYDSDIDTQITIQGIALNVNSEQFTEKYPIGCPVRGYKEGETQKTIFYLSPNQVMQWMADLSIHIGNCKQWGWGKQEEINSANTLEDLEEIEI